MRHVIPETTKTSLSDKDFASSYDNIWFDATYTAHEFAGKGGAIDCVNEFFPGDPGRFKQAKELISDHIPVWAEFRLDQEDDD